MAALPEENEEVLKNLNESGIEPEGEPFRTFEAVESKAERTQLTLLLSSVDRDIRMIVVDRNGNPVTGVPFRTELRSGKMEAEYEDGDMDGILYAADLPSGEYTVSLKPTPGYIAPEHESRVTVRESIAYTAIEDIEPLIKEEDEVDPDLDDTADIEEEDDGKLLNSGGIDLRNGSIGIDVSKYNRDIDWETVKNTGIEYAIIRLGYRGSSSGSLVEDPYFRKNMEGAAKAGMKIGLYFFTQALNSTEAIEEASMVAALVKPEELSLPVFLDVEASGGRADGLDKAKRTENINAFCETLQNLGYRAGVYANKRWFTHYIDTEALGDWKIWLAQYRVSSPSYEGSYDAWQYSSKGSVEGIEGNVDLDLNISLGD